MNLLSLEPSVDLTSWVPTLLALLDESDIQALAPIVKPIIPGFNKSLRHVPAPLLRKKTMEKLNGLSDVGAILHKFYFATIRKYTFLHHDENATMEPEFFIAQLHFGNELKPAGQVVAAVQLYPEWVKEHGAVIQSNVEQGRQLWHGLLKDLTLEQQLHRLVMKLRKNDLEQGWIEGCVSVYSGEQHIADNFNANVPLNEFFMASEEMLPSGHYAILAATSLGQWLVWTQEERDLLFRLVALDIARMTVERSEQFHEVEKLHEQERQRAMEDLARFDRQREKDTMRWNEDKKNWSLQIEEWQAERNVLNNEYKQLEEERAQQQHQLEQLRQLVNELSNAQAQAQAQMEAQAQAHAQAQVEAQVQAYAQAQADAEQAAAMKRVELTDSPSNRAYLINREPVRLVTFNRDRQLERFVAANILICVDTDEQLEYRLRKEASAVHWFIDTDGIETKRTFIWERMFKAHRASYRFVSGEDAMLIRKVIYYVEGAVEHEVANGIE
ncbi:hypothetical protein [Paenibacillus sp. 481]|uniref:hypothetical protein n=1 Tax=Paenibacillus sp. 481 TaxID=2835869 RepID=UPI001E2E6AEE|nr:hypothetical protein [Paenibacillus sp. 481]UHA72384.1 hypothetical protein KIK04_17105 [Paenibacillus sp. 481]